MKEKHFNSGFKLESFGVPVQSIFSQSFPIYLKPVKMIKKVQKLKDFAENKKINRYIVTVTE